MAQRRMTSLDVVDTDAFLDMPVSAQLLYFHLNVRADDDGFIANPRRVMRTIQVAGDDLKILVAKKFLIEFSDGVCVVKHWRVNNFIRKDLYKGTQYLDLKRTLYIRPNGAYTLNENGAMPVPDGFFNLNEVTEEIQEKQQISPTITLTQRKRSVNSGKDRIGKVSTVKQLPPQSGGAEVDDDLSKAINPVIELFKDINPSYTRLYAQKPQRAALERLIKTHGIEKITSVITFLPRSNGAKYAPTITTPIQLEIKLGELLAWSQKQKDTSSRGKNIII